MIRSHLAMAIVALVLGLSAHAQNGTEFEWDLPPGFPVPRVPADNPMSADKVELGRFLFYSERLSGNGTTACASCHRQELAFTDGRPRAVGSTGQIHDRGSMSLTNVAYNANLTWASHDVVSLEQQAGAPLFNETPVELGLKGREQEILDRFRADPEYRAMFRAAFPGQDEPITVPNVIRAIATFERTLISGNSAYDRLVYRGEMNALSPEARRGMRVFFSETTRCSECHGGFNFGGPVRFEGPDDIEPTFHNTGLYNLDGDGSYPVEDTGLHSLTGSIEDMGHFRAPTLRNVAVTAPYMHDGSVASLAEVVDSYAAGGRVITAGPRRGDGRANPYKSERIAGFELSESEKTDLIRFLESLTDTDFLTDPRLADPRPTEGRDHGRAIAER